jgi:Lon protease-like protein
VATELLPIFPLQSVVLFPGVNAPLHLFEPRYRQMAEAALAGNRRIGMIAVPPEHVAEMAGDPPVYDVGCAGVITQSLKLPDGRFNIILTGTDRFRIVKESPRPAGQGYRIAEVAILDDPFAASERDRVSRLRSSVVRLLRDLVRITDPERAGLISSDLFTGVDDRSFVNSLSHALSLAQPDKQGLLETRGVAARLERLEGLLAFRLAGIQSPGAAAPESVH